MSKRPISYTAKLDGKIVGKRKSHRVYTHAVVVRHSESYHRKRAYEYVATNTDRSNFEFYSFIATCEPGVSVRPNGWNTNTTFSAEEIAVAKIAIVGGLDAYVAKAREKAIERFEAHKASGEFEPGVVTWCGRADLAEKEVSKRIGSPMFDLVTAVHALVEGGSK